MIYVKQAPVGQFQGRNDEKGEKGQAHKCVKTAVYAEGDNRPKCVKLPLVTSFYEKERQEVIAEVRKKVYDLAKGYDEVIRHHAGCAYCEHRCQYYQRISGYIEEKVACDRVLEKWAARRYAPKSLAAFLDSELMKQLLLQNVFEKVCVLGYILAKQSDLNDGQRQKILAGYLGYKSRPQNR